MSNNVLENADGASLATIGILVSRLAALQGLEGVRITQDEYDSIAFSTLMEGRDIVTGDLVLKVTTKRGELS
jgi:hypothetical protein